MGTRDAFNRLRAHSHRRIAGQEAFVHHTLPWLLVNENLPAYGVPSISQARAIQTLTKWHRADFHCVQLPVSIASEQTVSVYHIGTQITNP